MTDDATTTTTDTGTSSDAAAAADAESTTAAETTFSQADVDRIVKDRLAREAKKYEGFNEIKQRAAKLDEIEAAQKTELQKATERATALEAQAKEASLRAQENALRAAVIGEAAKRKVHDPDAALALLDRGSLEYGDDGLPTNVAEAMDALLTAKPYLAGATPSADLGARGTAAAAQLKQDDLKTMSPEQIVAAQKEGRLNTLLGIT